MQLHMIVYKNIIQLTAKTHDIEQRRMLIARYRITAKFLSMTKNAKTSCEDL